MFLQVSGLDPSKLPYRLIAKRKKGQSIGTMTHARERRRETPRNPIESSHPEASKEGKGRDEHGDTHREKHLSGHNTSASGGKSTLCCGALLEGQFMVFECHLTIKQMSIREHSDPLTRGRYVFLPAS